MVLEKEIIEPFISLYLKLNAHYFIVIRIIINSLLIVMVYNKLLIKILLEPIKSHLKTSSVNCH